MRTDCLTGKPDKNRSFAVEINYKVKHILLPKREELSERQKFI